jgi:hypothetical protein
MPFVIVICLAGNCILMRHTLSLSWLNVNNYCFYTVLWYLIVRNTPWYHYSTRFTKSNCQLFCCWINYQINYQILTRSPEWLHMVAAVCATSAPCSKLWYGLQNLLYPSSNFDRKLSNDWWLICGGRQTKYSHTLYLYTRVNPNISHD